MIESEDNSYDETVETTYYTFDNAVLTSPGYVEIRQNKIYLHFPDISLVTEKPSSNYKCVQIFINNHLHFSFEWLPFFSFGDRIRIMDMILKSYQLFCNMIQGDFFLPFPHTNKSNYSYSSIVTQFKISNQFQIYCLENWCTTSIQISLCKPKKGITSENPSCTETETETEIVNQITPNNLTETPFHFQISIGKNIVIDSERDFYSLQQCHINFIVQLILFKIVHMD